MSEAVEPFHISVPETEILSLRRRLDDTRWPEKETVTDWSQGVPIAMLHSLCEHWRTAYDWRRCEARLNAFPNFRTELNGLGVHFIHARSPDPNALPLLITHGWPGSIIEFLKIIGPLTDPAAHGAPGARAFHVIAPSLPGYGFSDKPVAPGWGVERIADAWIALMRRLGYGRFVAQGGDWGAAVTTAIGIARPPECAAIHLNMALIFPEKSDFAELTPAEQATVERLLFYRKHDSGYAKLQNTRPQTIGYALADSPIGQAAWIYEKFHAWTDNNGAPESALSRDEMLDAITLYWLTNSATSSARLYWESLPFFKTQRVEMPVGVTIFPREIFRPSRRWAERSFPQLIYWNEPPKGGHFAAFEQPELFVTELRNCFATI